MLNVPRQILIGSWETIRIAWLLKNMSYQSRTVNIFKKLEIALKRTGRISNVSLKGAPKNENQPRNGSTNCETVLGYQSKKIKQCHNLTVANNKVKLKLWLAPMKRLSCSMVKRFFFLIFTIVHVYNRHSN